MMEGRTQTERSNFVVFLSLQMTTKGKEWTYHAARQTHLIVRCDQFDEHSDDDTLVKYLVETRAIIYLFADMKISASV